MSTVGIFLIIVAALIVFSLILFFVSRYKRCPSDKVLVVYGKVGTDSDGHPRSAKCVHGGAAWIKPVVQSFTYMDLAPMSFDVDLKDALSKQNIRVDVPCAVTVAIDTDPVVLNNAAERLLNKNSQEIKELASTLFFGQLRLVIAQMNIEELNTDRALFLQAVEEHVETEFKKVGLKLVNVNVTDITDKSGYIEAIGKEAAAAALNDAKKAVAEKNRDGDIGQSAASNEAKKAVAERDRDGSIGEAEAQRDQRIKLAAADADAVTGENTAKIQVANSDSALRVQSAEAQRKATAAEKVAEANALKESYAAQQAAENARADREYATQQADVVVKAKIGKEQIEIAAEASAEQARRTAKGEADATYAKMEAQARGIYEILSKQAEGMKKVVDAAGGDADKAVQLLLVDKLPDMVKTQVEAVKNLNFGNITVWDSGAGSKGGGNGSSLANFASGLMGVMPPLATTCKNAGFKIPGYLGSLMDDQADAAEIVQTVMTENAPSAAEQAAPDAPTETENAEPAVPTEETSTSTDQNGK